MLAFLFECRSLVHSDDLIRQNLLSNSCPARCALTDSNMLALGRILLILAIGESMIVDATAVLSSAKHWTYDIWVTRCNDRACRTSKNRMDPLGKELFLKPGKHAT